MDDRKESGLEYLEGNGGESIKGSFHLSIFIKRNEG